MTSRPVLAVLLVVLLGGAFLVGRASVDRSRPAPARGSFEDGLRSGREAAFSGFDGGWAYGKPYIVVLQRGGPEITYRIATRRPLLPGVEYSACAGGVCSRRG
jgi:hypothetical protein